jgi:hypothetical protein
MRPQRSAFRIWITTSSFIGEELRWKEPSALFILAPAGFDAITLDAVDGVAPTRRLISHPT